MSSKNKSIYVQGEYLKHNPDWHQSDSKWKAQQVSTLLKRNDLSPKSICEVGCGAGAILHQLSTRLHPSTTLIGYDISQDAINFCDQYKKLNLNYIHGDYFRIDTTYYDVVMAMDVAEHVENYMEFIRNLRKGGDYKIFHFPLEISVNKAIRKNALNRSRDRLGHLHYFSKETVLRTLCDCDHQIVDYFYTNSLDTQEQPLLTKLLRPIIKFFFWLNNDFTVRFWGGYSLIVLTK